MLAEAACTSLGCTSKTRSAPTHFIQHAASAGHAAFDKDSSDLSGLLVSDGQNGKEIFFTQKVRRLLKGQPLVFLNACQSGVTANEAMAPSTNYLLESAEGLATAFLYGGALACIGSLWPVYDQPAAEFALEFYRKALDGYMLGEAMRLARIETRRKYPRQVTWAAFALYGDATFRL
jgi:CHAT domain-containing protein